MYSIVIPYYQRESGILARCLEHIANQSAFDIVEEILLVDDGSPISAESELETLKKLNKHQELISKIKLLEKKNGGVSSARNFALDNISDNSIYVAFCDSDDMWMPHHLENSRVIHQHNAGFYFSNFYQLHSEIPAFERSNKINIDNHQNLGSGDSYKFIGSMEEQIISGNLIGTSTVAYNFKKHRNVRFNINLKLAGEDYLFWTEITRNEENIVFGKEPSVIYGQGINIFSGAEWGSSNLVERDLDLLKFSTILLETKKTSKTITDLSILKANDLQKKLIASTIANVKSGNLRKITPATAGIIRSKIATLNLKRNKQMNGDLKRIIKLILFPPITWVKNTNRAFKELSWIHKRTKEIEKYQKNSKSKLLNIGCGSNQLSGWLNTDFTPDSDDVIFMDATQKFPLESNSFDYIFSEHMIEHIPYDKAEEMLKECYRVIKPGGRIRISTPDLNKLTGLLTDNKTKDQINYTNWFTDKFIPGITDKITSETFVINKMVREWGHQFIYDEKTLSNAMQEVGFENIEKESPQHSNDNNLTNIDGHEKISGSDINNFETLTIEALKRGLQSEYIGNNTSL